MTILQGKKRFVETQFRYEEDLEELVRSQSKVLFGEHIIFIKTKRKLKGLVLGNTIPDGFLFDLTDSENPEFYLVEFELQHHDFDGHISRQITKFFGFFRNPASQKKLVKDLNLIIKADVALKGGFKKYLGDGEIHEFLTEICANSQNILLVIDEVNEKLTETMNTCTDTWGKFVKILTVKQFANENEILVAVEPDFVDIRNTPDEVDTEIGKKPLTTGQRAMIAAEMSMRPNSNVSKAAKETNSGRGNVHIAKKIKLADPALAKLVKSGKLSLHAAEMRITNPKKVISK